MAGTQSCFVLLPSGGNVDAVYAQIIHPAVRAAGLDPLRVDVSGSGPISRSVLDQLLLCDYAVVDVTWAAASLFHHVGARHATRPRATVLLHLEDGRPRSLDAPGLCILPYQLDAAGQPANASADSARLAAHLVDARKPGIDVSLYQLLQDYPFVAHEKTDVFRDRANYSREIRTRLEQARHLQQGARHAIKAVEADLEPVSDAEAGALIDVMLSYRAVSAWEDAISLISRFSVSLRESVLVQEQLAFALNRAGRSEQAEQVLLDLIARHGSSSETHAILGRVYKDRWLAAAPDRHGARAAGLLHQAVDAYLKGFESDWRDALPGINTVTLMELMEPPDPRRVVLLPIVNYAVQRRIAAGRPDYWDYAALIELAVLGGVEEDATAALSQALARVREPWEPASTARNLRLIGETSERRGTALPWLAAILQQLEAAAR